MSPKVDTMGVNVVPPLIHFLLSIIAGLGVGIHIENKAKKYLLIIVLALTSVCIDFDHLLPIYHQSDVKAFHNIIIFIIIPVSILIFFTIYELRKETTHRERACIILAIMFVGHMFCDCTSAGGLPFFFPFSQERFIIGNLGMTINQPALTLTSAQVALIIWGLMIVCANVAETIIYRSAEGFVLYNSNIANRNSKKNGWTNYLPNIVSSMVLKDKSNVKPVNMVPNVQVDMTDPHSSEDVRDYIFTFIDSLPD